MSSRKEQQKIWTALFVAIISISFLDSTSLQALSNITPLYIESIAGTATLSGVLATVFSFAGGVGRLTGGWLTDNVGRRKIMMGGLALLCIGAAIPAVIPTVPMLMVARTLQGLGFAMTATAAGSAAADVLPEERLGEGIGYFALGQSLASAVGPAFGIWLSGFGNFVMAFFVVAGIVAIGILVASFCRYEKDPGYLEKVASAKAEHEKARLENGQGKRNILAVLFEKHALIPAAMNMSMSLGFAAYMNFLSLYGQRMGFSNIGVFFTISAVVMLACRIFLTRYIDRFHPIVIVVVTYGAGVMSFLLVAFGANMPCVCIAGVCYGFAFGIIMPFLNVLAVKGVPAHRRGAATATCYIGADLGMGFGGTLCGMFIDSVGFKIMFCIGAGWLVIAMLIGVVASLKKAFE